ncbi:MAG: hypothetical protein EBR20_10485, partial [Bacteroidetes bacterium]|nr:hypothetical protein [Bacteroidota bacterium]
MGRTINGTSSFSGRRNQQTLISSPRLSGQSLRRATPNTLHLGLTNGSARHWARMEARKPLVRPIHELMDEHYFHQRGNGKVNSIHDEIAAYITADQWDDPNLVAFANGTLDVKRGILLPGHQQTHRLTFCFPFDFDPQAQCPLWLDFITRTYTKADGSPDPDAVNVLRAAFRWTICPKPPD